jgi:hypothetical protein
MMDDSDSYEAFGAGVDTVAWSWRYLRHPGVLFPWLACAGLSAFLGDGGSQRRERERAEPAPAPRRPLALSAHTRSGQEPPRSDHDDEARAA